jgi:hypothetical protein
MSNGLLTIICFNDAFQTYLRGFIRRVHGYDITLNLEIYSPGIGVCNITCIPQKELQNLTRGPGIQGLNIETAALAKRSGSNQVSENEFVRLIIKFTVQA